MKPLDAAASSSSPPVLPCLLHRCRFRHVFLITSGASSPLDPLIGVFSHFIAAASASSSLPALPLLLTRHPTPPVLLLPRCRLRHSVFLLVTGATSSSSSLLTPLDVLTYYSSHLRPNCHMDLLHLLSLFRLRQQQPPASPLDPLPLASSP